MQNRTEDKKVSSAIVYCTTYCVSDSSYTVLPCRFLSSVQYMFWSQDKK